MVKFDLWSFPNKNSCCGYWLNLIFLKWDTQSFFALTTFHYSERTAPAPLQVLHAGSGSIRLLPLSIISWGDFFVFFVYWSWNTLKDKCTKKTSCAAIRKPALSSEAEGKAKKQTTEQWIINERSFMCHKQEPQYGTGRVIQTLTNTNIHLQIYIIPLPPTNCAMLFQTIKHAVLIFDALLVPHCRDPTSCFLLLCCWAVG